MGALKCKMCGSNLEIEDSITVCKCEKCGTSQTVPDIEDDKELKLFERAGRLRFNCDFDKAAGIYNTITDSYPEEAEGYWGLVLCKYGIEYADNASGKKVPVCHRISYDSVMDDEDFELVMENSDSESRAIFREEAKIIEENRKKYIQIAESEQPYDIYISYRAKDDNGDKTAVSEIAGHLYNKLTSAGYRVFLSEAALKGKKRSECEPYIYSALNSANVMLALGTSYDDYNDVWVKNEWNRYLEIAEKNKNKCLIPCYKDVDEYDIPKEFAGLKVCQLGNDDTFNNIMAEIANVVKPESVNQPAPEPEKAEPAEEIELEEIEIIEPVNINKLLDEGFSAISDKNWKKANKLFFQVLDEEPDNSKAYWGQLLVQQECTNAREMADNLYLQVIGNTSDNTYELEIRDRRQEIKDKYPVANLFSEEEYANLFDVHFNYQSGVENTKSAIAANNEHYILSDNELFKRAKQNADAEVAAGIEEFVANVNRHLDEILKNVTEQEQQEIEAARQQETAYFSKLEDAFKKADDMANANLSNSEAEYQKDHDSWEYERDNLEEARQQWVKDVEEKQKEHDEWLAVNGAAIEEWNAKKKEYNDNKQKLEYELKRLQEDKGFIEGFMAGAKAAKKDKEIMNVRIELSRLALPKEPIMPKEPVIPPEPALRREPEKPDYDIMIGRNDVLDTFRSLMA
ncbi:TIR domain-containing protein [Lachnospira eligens]|nr:toll/interleukin-1 receptor domain-containing protein [Lachnospira eligens]UEA98310.1 TIR domain-containing protein [Lachnospira eligens]